MSKNEFIKEIKEKIIDEVRTNNRLDNDTVFMIAEMLNIRKLRRKIKKLLKEDSNFNERDEANAITAYAFRNTFLEDLHAGKHSKILESNEYSRITQDEMKKLMIESSAKVEELILMKKYNPIEFTAFIRQYNYTYCREWDRKRKKFSIKKK
ncbi:MAG: hypothetical protein ABIJ34_04280 [archaeon]